jgi:hypothetical protein
MTSVEIRHNLPEWFEDLKRQHKVLPRVNGDCAVPCTTIEAAVSSLPNWMPRGSRRHRGGYSQSFESGSIITRMRSSWHRAGEVEEKRVLEKMGTRRLTHAFTITDVVAVHWDELSWQVDAFAGRSSDANINLYTQSDRKKRARLSDDQKAILTIWPANPSDMEQASAFIASGIPAIGKGCLDVTSVEACADKVSELVALAFGVSTDMMLIREHISAPYAWSSPNLQIFWPTP